MKEKIKCDHLVAIWSDGYEHQLIYESEAADCGYEYYGVSEDFHSFDYCPECGECLIPKINQKTVDC